MPKKQKTKPTDIAVIDIGSNSVRLVIYRGFNPVYEKKTHCRLARNMTHDKPKLEKKNMDMTINTLHKFGRIIRKRKIKKIIAVGTAAMRAVIHTKQGRKFHKRAQNALGYKITVISGRLEARLTALGVMSEIPKATGICGDLGGGSLELASITRGKVGHTVTLALGSLTLINESKGNPIKAEMLMHARLNPAKWLSRHHGCVFYPIGGSWRAVGRIMRKMLHMPPRRIQGFTLRADIARRCARIIERQKSSAFKKMPRKIRQRADVIPYAAAVLVELIERIQPAKITFSAHGLREGLLMRKIS